MLTVLLLSGVSSVAAPVTVRMFSGFPQMQKKKLFYDPPTGIPLVLQSPREMLERQIPEMTEKYSYAQNQRAVMLSGA